MKYLKNKFKEFLRSYFVSLEKDLDFGMQRLAASKTCDYINENMLNCLTLTTREDIYTYVSEYISKNELGLFLEFGVYKGESINFMADLLPECMFHGFDSFEGLPEFWRAGFDKAAFHMNGGLPKVKNNVTLHKGWFEDTIPVFLQTNKVEKIQILHIDCDIYSSTNTIFNLLGHLIEKGTVIIFDEYFNYPGWENHEYQAFQEFIHSSGKTYEYLAYNSKNEQVVVRIL